MRIEAFENQYDLAARLYRVSAEELRARDGDRPPARWLALDGAEPAGAVTMTRRPDRRRFLSFTCVHSGAYAPLIAGVAAADRGNLHTTAEADDTEQLAILHDAGFVTEIEFEQFRVSFDAALARLPRTEIPTGFTFQRGDAVDEMRHFSLDNAIRQDVPGCDGWRGDLDSFREELADSPPFDPAAYLVAIDDRNGEYVGLVRIWRNRSGPRIGLIGVIRQYRGTPVAAVLLRRALEAAARWGHDTFTTEASLQNPVTHRALTRLNARSEGISLQLVRRP